MSLARACLRDLAAFLICTAYLCESCWILRPGTYQEGLWKHRIAFVWSLSCLSRSPVPFVVAWRLCFASTLDDKLLLSHGDGVVEDVDKPLAPFACYE